MFNIQVRLIALRECRVLSCLINPRCSDLSTLVLPPPTCQIALLRQKKTWSHSSPNMFCQRVKPNYFLQNLCNILLSIHTEMKKKTQKFPFQHITRSIAHLVPNFSAMEVLKRSQVVKKSNWLEMLDLSQQSGMRSRKGLKLLVFFSPRTVKAQKDVLILVDFTDSHIRYPKTCNVIYIYLRVCTYMCPLHLHLHLQSLFHSSCQEKR